MNKFSDEQIMKDLLQVYEDYTFRYTSNNIYGVFLLGRFNYGWGRDINDYKFLVIYLPTFEGLCIKPPFQRQEGNVEFIDMRCFYTATINEDWSCIEILFTKYSIINPKYKKIHTQYFYNKRELIARYNEQSRLKKAFNCAETSFANGDYFEVARLYLGAKNYSKIRSSCEDSFHLKDRLEKSYLDAVEAGQVDKDEIFELLEEMESFVSKANTITNLGAETAVKEGVVAIISAGLNQGISADIFRQTLTSTEQKAFDAIIDRLNEYKEGNISISKIVEETGISRPVYKNLFIKMEKAKAAEINNQGVKGMFIKMLTT